jgi:hypothetical protein
MFSEAHCSEARQVQSWAVLWRRTGSRDRCRSRRWHRRHHRFGRPASRQRLLLSRNGCYLQRTDGAWAVAHPRYCDPAYAAPPPPPAPVAGDAEAYCMQKYRSYDPRTGTFMGYDGIRRPCP